MTFENDGRSPVRGKPLTIKIDAHTVGIGYTTRYGRRDLWQHSTTETAGRITAHVPPHSVVLYRVSRRAPADARPAVFLSVPETPAHFAGSDLRLAIPGLFDLVVLTNLRSIP